MKLKFSSLECRGIKLSEQEKAFQVAVLEKRGANFYCKQLTRVEQWSCRNASKLVDLLVQSGAILFCGMKESDAQLLLRASYSITFQL